MQPVADLRERVREMSRDDFLGLFPAPVLVATSIIGGRLGRAHRGAPRSTAQRIQRLKPTTLVHIEPDSIEDPRDDDIMVTRSLRRKMWVPVVKSVRTEQEPRITVGRFATCDVVINDYTVSKRHAVVAIDPLMGRFWLTDMGSTNGTRVEDLPLDPGQAAAVRSGQRLTFGRLIFQLLDAHDFFDYLCGHPARHAAAGQRAVEVVLAR